MKELPIGLFPPRKVVAHEFQTKLYVVLGIYNTSKTALAKQVKQKVTCEFMTLLTLPRNPSSGIRAKQLSLGSETLFV